MQITLQTCFLEVIFGHGKDGESLPINLRHLLIYAPTSIQRISQLIVIQVNVNKRIHHWPGSSTFNLSNVIVGQIQVIQ